MIIADETQPDGETSGDDISGLILAHLETRTERNVAEAQAIIHSVLTYAA